MLFGFFIQLLLQPADTAKQLQEIKQYEYALSTAINNRDAQLFDSLSELNLRVSWSYHKGTSNYTATYQRNEWTKRLANMPLRWHRVQVKNIKLMPSIRPDQMSTESEFASVDLIESWDLISRDGSELKMELNTIDAWRKTQGHWKLAARLSRPNERTVQ